MLWHFFKPYLPRFIFALIFMMMASSATASISYAFKPALDHIFTKSATLYEIYQFGTFIFGVFLIKGIGNYGESTTLNSITAYIIYDMQTQMFEKLLYGPLDYIRKKQTGELTMRLMGELNTLRLLMINVFRALGKDLLTIIFLFFLILYYDVYLTFLCLVIIPIALCPIYFICRKIDSIASRLHNSQAHLSGVITEILRHIPIVKSFVNERFEINRFKNSAQLLRNDNIKTARIGNLILPITECTAGTIISVILVYGAISVYDGSKTTGGFIAFISALLLAYEPIKHIAILFGSELQNIKVILARIEEIMKLTTTHPLTIENHSITSRAKQSSPFNQNSNGQKNPIRPESYTFVGNEEPLKLQGNIEMKDICVSYGNHKILNHVNFRVNSGEKVAFIGPSGSGKTTLFNLLLRFVEPTNGSIYIDGKKIQEFDVYSLRKNISLVSQDIALFNLSIRDNICYGNHQISQAAISNACDASYSSSFINNMQDGLDTLLSENGSNLSGGQKQRLTIARAILKNAPILLLDEITSALDKDIQTHLNQSIAKLIAGKTTLIITHKLTIPVDHIFLIDHQTLVEITKEQYAVMV